MRMLPGGPGLQTTLIIRYWDALQPEACAPSASWREKKGDATECLRISTSRVVSRSQAPLGNAVREALLRVFALAGTSPTGRGREAELRPLGSQAELGNQRRRSVQGKGPERGRS